MKLKNYDTGDYAKCECGHNRFKTVEKGHLWKCRKCGTLRAYVKEEDK